MTFATEFLGIPSIWIYLIRKQQEKDLLVQGGTTYETIDFESSQNLLFLSNTKRTHQQTMRWPDEYFPPGHRLQDTGSFQCTVEELAPGHTKHFHFVPETLDNNQCWDIMNVDNVGQDNNQCWDIMNVDNVGQDNNQCWDIMNVDNVGQDSTLMFPSRQHTTSMQSNDLSITTRDQNSYQSTSISIKPHSLPAIFVDQPHISSESGYMKFIYRTRWDFKIAYTLHTQEMNTALLDILFDIRQQNHGLLQITFIMFNSIVFHHYIKYFP
jgi:hypothetical protein